MEIWKDVEGFEGHYKISNLCRVKSLHRIVYHKHNVRVTIPERILKPSITVHGYHQYGLRINNKNNSIKAHRLLATHFIPNPNKYRCINHIDGNKINNNLDNLEWCSYSHNTKHAYKLGLMEAHLKGININKPAVKINQYSLDGKFIRSYDSMSKAYKATGVHSSSISSCISKNYRRDTAGGFIWKIAAT